MQRSGTSSSPILLAFLSDNDAELLLESALAQMNHESADKDSGPHHYKDEEHDLLERVDDTKIDGTQAGESHRANDQEERVNVSDTRCCSACSPEDYRRDHACHYEVSIV